MKRLYFVIIFALIGLSICAQEFKPGRALDTIQHGRFNVVLFSDNTWQYVNHDSISSIIDYEDSIKAYSYILKNKLYVPDSMQVFSEKWDTVNIFAYGNMDFKRAQDTLAIPILSDTGKFVIPTLGRTQGGFGWRNGGMHNGIDLELKIGDTVLNAMDGIVRYAGWNNGGYGYLVIIRHYNGLETYYAHLSALKCKENEAIKAGDLVGLGGRTGRAYGPHLHFEVRFKDNPFDPAMLINFDKKELIGTTLFLLPEKFGHVKEMSEAQYYTIRSGDTLWAISNRQGVSMKYICNLNNITETSTLQIGQKLRVK